MLVRLEIENYYSIKDRQVLDFSLPKTTPVDERFSLIPLEAPIRVPNVITFFGPNASGKTSVIRAIIFMRNFLSSSFEYYEPNEDIEARPFDCEDCHHKDIKLAMEFYPAKFFRETDRLFRYELSIRTHGRSNAVSWESLKISEGGRKYSSVFERSLKGDEYEIKAHPDFGLSRNDPRRSVRKNVSLISSLVQFDHKQSSAFRSVFQMTFLANIDIQKYTKDVDTVTKFLSDNDDTLEHLNRRIRIIDLGIERVEISNINGKLQPVFYHIGLDSAKTLDEESQGTKSFYLNFIDIQLSLEAGGVAVMDELDADLHPNLMAEILRWFQDTDENSEGAQLVMSCHNASLISELFKEEVWLVNKNGTGVTEVLPLRGFKGLRRDTNLYAKYLSGAFGAVPRFG